MYKENNKAWSAVDATLNINQSLKSYDSILLFIVYSSVHYTHRFKENSKTRSAVDNTFQVNFNNKKVFILLLAYQSSTFFNLINCVVSCLGHDKTIDI
jgi:hypothetical protein